MSTHTDHHFSIQIYTSDVAILNCLRALADYTQETGNSRITWGGTGRDNWEQNNQQVTFHFTDPEYRHHFKQEASRVLPYDSWSIVQENDNDPATPQA